MYPQTLGVYSKKGDKEVGSGGTTSSYQQETFWFARRISDEKYEVRPLSSNHVPTGMKTLLGKGEFIAQFTPEARYYETRTLPVLKSLQKKIELGEQFFKKGLLSKAEKEFLKATMIDEESAPANLGLGSVYAEQGEFKKVKKVIGILLNSDMAFQEEQRQEFNVFGITLRKQGLHEDAIRFYSKALEYNDSDEHLNFNLARAYYEHGDHLECLQNIETALKINPNFVEAKKFLDFLRKTS
ncbi:tetratricopeptide repeat protein [Desulfovibrio ferrophilus]|uniref:Tetratricopeptide TPR_1 repeat-containing protein n=1 Tax=Desulfovibrio ferrophilus TaxID=241368 RepID=A0A2Z6AUL3_9BACT|nr:tetratricopeptide repeat protein [Desulfovibrio ferrophilus]BBD06885.1 tetratricopeptide TPR_1 repeat-containing protein [Desulfovibrio ferrophilus]